MTSQEPATTTTTTKIPATTTPPTTTATTTQPTTTAPAPTTTKQSAPSNLAPASQAEVTVSQITSSGDGSSEPAARMLEQLSLLVGVPDPTRPRYDRDLFFEGGDLDGDCIRTRHEVLQEEAINYTMSVNGCKVTVGEWYDPFTDRYFTNPGDLQMDHVVALGDAWSSGAWAWTDGQREQFSNDTTNLNVIYGPENQSKSDKGPARYTPSNPAQECAYLVQYGAVKAAWQLTISQADFDAIANGLADCGSTAPAGPPPATSTTTTTSMAVAVPPVAPTTVPATTAPVTTIALTTTTGECHPDYSPCLPNLAGNAINCGDLPSNLKPVTVLTPGVDPYRLDGDGDGKGCEGG